MIYFCFSAYSYISLNILYDNYMLVVFSPLSVSLKQLPVPNYLVCDQRNFMKNLDIVDNFTVCEARDKEKIIVIILSHYLKK